MAADLFPANSVRDSEAMASEVAIHMDDNGYYWHLYPYFESAKLPCDHELIDLYGDNEISGYELDRLRARLIVAQQDLAWRSDAWDVVTGWNGGDITPETEIKRSVEKRNMLDTIERFLALIDYCKSNGFKLCVFGD